MTGYSLDMFGKMFADRQRHDAYERALRESIRPGDVVLDIGTGIGVYALLAAKLGARRVFAVEPNPFVELGPRLAATNGLADRVEFIEAMSTQIDLPEPVDVVVADLRGVLPYHEHNFASLRDARRRFLKPGGIMMPTSDRIFAALATNANGERQFRSVWIDNPFDLDLSEAMADQAHALRQDSVRPDDLRSEPFQISSVDYASSDEDNDFDHRAAVEITSPGTVHGFSVWFEATVLPGITYATGPFSPPTVYGMAFLPFGEPREVEEGDTVSVRLSARQADDDYVWTWGAFSGDDAGGAPDWEVEQTTFRSTPIDVRRIMRRRANHRIGGSRALDADRTALQMLSEGATLGETSDALVADFGDVVADAPAALTRVADLAERYG